MTKHHTWHLTDPDLVGIIAQETLNTERREARREFRNETTNSVLARLLSSNHAAVAAVTGKATAASAAAVGVVAAPALLPIGLTLAAIALGVFKFRKIKQRKEIALPDEKTLEYFENIDKKIQKRTIGAVVNKYANVYFLKPRPTSKVTNPQREEARTETTPIGISSAQELSIRLQDYCEKHGCEPAEAQQIARLANGFAEAEMGEEFRVLQAAKTLRHDFHLTPKPKVKWGKRKADGSEITVGDVLGEYLQDLPYRDTVLADLTSEQWWEAFYQEDAETGRIGDWYLQKNDPGFQTKYRRDLKVGSLSGLMEKPDIAKRENNLATVLGGVASEVATYLSRGGRPSRINSSERYRSSRTGM
jgi:hypothetical protein